MKADVFDHRVCELGEGPLWHPERGQLFWFDILGKRLLTQSGGGAAEWTFNDHVSAAGWVDHDTLLIASETGLYRFDLTSGARELVAPLEADNPVTRSNDGRADPWGGFWIGTMGKKLESKAGAIYRYFRGELRQLFAHVTVSNAICFSPDRHVAFYTDTPTMKVMQQRLSPEHGWPDGEPSVFLDLTKEKLRPDGAVIDNQGTMWLAQWGAARVAAYDPSGRLVNTVGIDALQSSCPAFGGDDLRSLFCTSAAEGQTDGAGGLHGHGKTFVARVDATGQAEHQVVL